MSLFSYPIKNLKSVGEKRASLFCKIGAPSAGALLLLYPRTYEDWSTQYNIENAPVGVICAVKASFHGVVSSAILSGGMRLIKAMAYDETGSITLTYFNNPYIVKILKQDEEYVFYGKITESFGKKEILSPVFAPIDKVPVLRPIYPQTKGLTSKMIQNAVTHALELLPENMADTLPQNIRKEENLCDYKFALNNIHNPQDKDSMLLARKRLIFEELLVLQLGILTMKVGEKERAVFSINEYDTNNFWNLVPFNPTKAQRRCVDEALSDMKQKIPMNRLIQGDVGSGKTVIAAALCYFTFKSGMQSALMAPTDILAHQHYNFFSKIFINSGIKIELLTGSLTVKQKKIIKEKLENHEIDIIIGTHALITQDVKFFNLGLVITDEQHRFGVRQRAMLKDKSRGCHVLVMSATPIPRTLALIIYGDLQISVIDELPPGRQKIKTLWINSAKRDRAVGFLEKQILSGQQCYIICPMIDDKSEKASVTKYAEELIKKLPKIKIGVLHGKMKSSEKDIIMSNFSNGKIDILVSTTVVEVGVDVPNATVIMIENAEQYGLSQLHQLRGRVGRGKNQSYCILVSDAQNDVAVERMKTMCSTQNGFEIADKDLKLRGPGDFFGKKQHGLPQLRIADLNTDMQLLKRTQIVAKKIIEEDSNLESPKYHLLHGEVKLLKYQTD